MNEISRRSFLRGLPGIFGRSAISAGKGALAGFRKSQAEVSMRRLPLPSRGEVLDGIPAVHPWIAIAHALCERLGRRYPYLLLLGASGEAFRVSWPREGGDCGDSPVNTFLAALEIAGLTGHVMQGGPFAPALGGAEASIRKGLAVVVGSRSGPAVLASVSFGRSEVEWIHERGEPRRVPFEDFEREWEGAAWSSGPAPFLRITVERGSAPRPLDEVARAGVEAMAMVLEPAETETAARGLAAWEAWAKDLREDSIPAERAGAVHGERLARLGVGRSAAGRFFEAIARATDPDERDRIAALADIFREIHEPDPTGGIWGTGLLPEAAECLLTDGRPDPAKLADPALRERAAELLLEIRDREARALDLARSEP